MSEKVRLPRRVSEALEVVKYKGAVAIMAHVARCFDREEMTPISELSIIARYYHENPYVMASAIINGYEVEMTPEDKVMELFNERTDSLIRFGIRSTLDALGIKISGVNAE